MNVYIFKQGFTFIERAVANFTLYRNQCSFLLTVLAFRCPLSVYSQIDSGCGIKIVAVFVSTKNTLSRHQPTNPDPGSVSTTSVQNKQPPAPNASNQNNHTQTGVKKFSGPKRTPTRHSAAKDFSVWRQACFIMAPKTGSKKLVDGGHKGTSTVGFCLQSQSHPLIAQMIKPAGSGDPPPSSSTASSTGSHEHPRASQPVQFQ